MSGRISSLREQTADIGEMDLPRCVYCGDKTANEVETDRATVPLCTGCEGADGTDTVSVLSEDSSVIQQLEEQWDYCQERKRSADPGSGEWVWWRAKAVGIAEAIEVIEKHGSV